MRGILAILQALHDTQVDYVVVGGVAVVLQGHPRMTVDLDLALDLRTDNVRDVLETLAVAGLRPRLPVPALDFADPQIRRGWVEERHLVAFTLQHPDDALVEVDLLATTPIPYAELAASADQVVVGGIGVPVASVEHLIAMKRATGRTQDLADVEALSLLGDRSTLEGDGG